ncbi:MAG: glycosyltransferase family 39 protein, partial [Anaerolineales bacterium]|nr:glycosyltransferase family 39 protein [Anaerolineales bacterium]
HHSPFTIFMRKLLLLILLLAAGLRLYRLTEIPPGLTHDEANHGREAIGVLDGDLRYYFPYNYGSEPLYSYTVAGTMALLGENLFALRLVNVIFGVAAIGITYLWAARAFDRRVAAISALLLTLSFWPLASSREALRAGMLPFFMGTAVWFFWRFFEQKSGQVGKWASGQVVGFVLALLATLHIYLAARVAWLVFPAFLIYLAMVNRPLLRRGWRQTALGLAATAVLITPMFIYLHNNPAVQPRVGMLDGSLQALRDGNLLPILQNAAEALLAFIWPGHGDQFLAYNIPGRPVFDAVTAVFFTTGLFIILYRAISNKPLAISNGQFTIHNSLLIINYSPAFLLLWFLIGIIPSLVTGPTANTTRNLAALAPVHILPAVGFVALMDWGTHQLKPRLRGKVWGVTAVKVTAVLWLLLAGFFSVRDYFVRWGQSPDVRTAYQVTQIAMFDFAAQHNGKTVSSSALPGAAHDPSVALVTHPNLPLRWTDARYALIWPGGEAAHALIPASTPPHALFAAALRPLQTIAMRPSDLDPSFTYYELAAPPAAWLADAPLANFDDAVLLRYAAWVDDEVVRGETAVLLTVWQVQDPTRVGPLTPPADVTDAVLFTQILTDGGVLAQRDSLEAPTWDWQRGDIIAQIHPIPIPADTPPGEYRAIVGLYDRASGERRPVLDSGETFVDVRPLRVVGR